MGALTGRVEASTTSRPIDEMATDWEKSTENVCCRISLLASKGGDGKRLSGSTFSQAGSRRGRQAWAADENALGKMGRYRRVSPANFASTFSPSFPDASRSSATAAYPHWTARCAAEFSTVAVCELTAAS